MIETYHYDESADRLIVQRTQDVEPILDANKRDFDPDNRRWGRLMNHVARIPLVVIEQYYKRGIDLLQDERELRIFLNDKDNQLFRTKPGRI